MEIKLKSTITCPYCRHKKEEAMPTDACLYFYSLRKLQKEIKPSKGRLLRFLLLWLDSMPAYPIQQGMLLNKEAYGCQCLWSKVSLRLFTITCITIFQRKLFNTFRNLQLFFTLFKVRDHCFSGKQQASDTCGILQRYP